MQVRNKNFNCLICIISSNLLLREHLIKHSFFLVLFSCSPSQGPCCTSECTFKFSNVKCREESECALQGMCNGNSAQCPTSTPKENFTSCHTNTQVCLSGVGAASWAVCSFCTAPIECFLSLGIYNGIKSLNVENLMSKCEQILHLINVIQFDLFVFMLAQMHTHENFQALNISHCICAYACVIVVFVLRTFCLRM